MAFPSASQETGFGSLALNFELIHRIAPLWELVCGNSASFFPGLYCQRGKRGERVLVWMPFSCLIRTWAECLVFLQSCAHISASSRPFSGFLSPACVASLALQEQPHLRQLRIHAVSAVIFFQASQMQVVLQAAEKHQQRCQEQVRAQRPPW